MIQIVHKLRNNVAVYVLQLCLFTVGFLFVGNMKLDAKGDKEFKVAMLLPASISDGVGTLRLMMDSKPLKRS